MSELTLGAVPDLILGDEYTRLLLFIVTFCATHPRGPTYTEMEEFSGRSRQTIARRLHVLYDKGLVDWLWMHKGTLHPLVRIV